MITTINNGCVEIMGKQAYSIGNNYPTNIGTNIWVMDSRRYFGNYRIANPANDAGLGSWPPAIYPIDVSNSSVLNIVGSGTYAPNTRFVTADFDYPTIKFINPSGLSRMNFSTTTLNSTNNASSLTAFYRVKIDQINTTNNVGILFSILNNNSTAPRFTLYFDNQYGAGNGILVIEVNNVDSGAIRFYLTANVRLNDIIGKWVTIAIDINFLTKTVRFWLNGVLKANTFISGMTAGNIPNTNATYVSVLGDVNYWWIGSCTYARMTKNGSMTNDDAVKMHNLMENATLS